MSTPILVSTSDIGILIVLALLLVGAALRATGR
jgi:hypothetical protein